MADTPGRRGGVRQGIVEAVADASCRRLTTSVIRLLQKQPGGLSGDDSALVTFWDEFCVQVQEGESFFWQSYVDTAIQLIEAEVERLPRYEREAIWLQSEAGWDWLWDVDNWQEEETAPPNDVPAKASEAAEYVFNNYLREEAENFSNEATDEYLKASQIARFESDRLPENYFPDASPDET